MNGYVAWSNYLAIHGPSQFYGTSGFHVVYAPFFQYFLWFTGEIANRLSLSTALHVVLIKLWSVLFEFIGAWLILLISEKANKPETGTIMAFIYLVNPGVYINSSIWGQFDSIPATMLIGVIALFEFRKHNLAALLFLIAVLTKPQSGLLLPVVLYLYFKDFKMDLKSFLRLITGLVSGLLIYYAIVLPFYLPTSLANKLPKFIDPLYWIFELYYNSIKDYPFATANAFNFWFLLGGQIQPDKLPFLGLSYFAWGNILTLAAVLYAFICLIKGGASIYSIAYSSYLVQFSAFFFMTKMHERYLLPAIIFITLTSVFDKKHLLLLGLVSFSVFINHLYLYIISFGEVYWLERWDGLAMLFSFFVLITYMLSVYQGYRAFIKPGNNSTGVCDDWNDY
jgi:Gpi18-like mannosyltransferase